MISDQTPTQVNHKEFHTGGEPQRRCGVNDLPVAPHLSFLIFCTPIDPVKYFWSHNGGIKFLLSGISVPIQFRIKTSSCRQYVCFVLSYACLLLLPFSTVTERSANYLQIVICTFPYLMFSCSSCTVWHLVATLPHCETPLWLMAVSQRIAASAHSWKGTGGFQTFSLFFKIISRILKLNQPWSEPLAWS